MYLNIIQVQKKIIFVFLLLLLFIPNNVFSKQSWKLYNIKLKLNPKIVEVSAHNGKNWDNSVGVGDIQAKDKDEEFLDLLKHKNFSLVAIDGVKFKFNDFNCLSNDTANISAGILLNKKIKLKQGEHQYKKIENDIFEIDWIILEPVSMIKKQEIKQCPEIIFKKINPTKYFVKVNRATAPFWLVFSETFHKQWNLYKVEGEKKSFGDVVADYPQLRVKEAEHLEKFSPGDLKFLWQKSLPAIHQMVNGYANGWYIEPDELGLGENFTLALYFFPQSLFYLGLMISGISFLGSIVFLWSSCLRRKKK